MLYTIDKTETRISELRNDNKSEKLIERTEALETSIEETDTKTIPSKCQPRVTSLGKTTKENLKFSKISATKKCNFKGNSLKKNCRYGQRDLKSLGILKKGILLQQIAKMLAMMCNVTFRNISVVGHL